MAFNELSRTLQTPDTPDPVLFRHLERAAWHLSLCWQFCNRYVCSTRGQVRYYAVECHSLSLLTNRQLYGLADATQHLDQGINSELSCFLIYQV